VKSILNEPFDKAMVKSINDIDHVIGLKTIAEFLDNNAIKEQLKSLVSAMPKDMASPSPDPLVTLLIKVKRVQRFLLNTRIVN
jgi:hypothetical protein